MHQRTTYLGHLPAWPAQDQHNQPERRWPGPSRLRRRARRAAARLATSSSTEQVVSGEVAEQVAPTNYEPLENEAAEANAEEKETRNCMADAEEATEATNINFHVVLDELCSDKTYNDASNNLEVKEQEANDQELATTDDLMSILKKCEENRRKERALEIENRRRERELDLEKFRLELLSNSSPSQGLL